MSATPKVPLLQAAIEAGIEVEIIQIPPLRQAKRFTVWDKRNFNSERTPPNSLMFTTHFPEEMQPWRAQKMLDLNYTPPGSNRIIAHPNFVFGYNPHINVNVGFCQVTRHYCVASTHPQLTKLEHKTFIEYECFVQSFGRLSRNFDSGAIMVTPGITQIAPLRFEPPKFPDVTVFDREFK